MNLQSRITDKSFEVTDASWLGDLVVNEEVKKSKLSFRKNNNIGRERGEIYYLCLNLRKVACWDFLSHSPKWGSFKKVCEHTQIP